MGILFRPGDGMSCRVHFNVDNDRVCVVRGEVGECFPRPTNKPIGLSGSMVRYTQPSSRAMPPWPLPSQRTRSIYTKDDANQNPVDLCLAACRPFAWVPVCFRPVGGGTAVLDPMGALAPTSKVRSQSRLCHTTALAPRKCISPILRQSIDRRSVRGVSREIDVYDVEEGRQKLSAAKEPTILVQYESHWRLLIGPSLSVQPVMEEDLLPVHHVLCEFVEACRPRMDQGPRMDIRPPRSPTTPKI